MVEFVGPDLSLLVDIAPISERYSRKFESLVLPTAEKRWPPLARRVQQWFEWERHARLLSDSMQKAEIDCALVHYLVYAVRYRTAWERTNKPVFVHCHGWDVTWELQGTNRGLSGTRVHRRGYARAAAGLPDNVRFIANSHATAAKLGQIGIDEERIIIKPLGVPCLEDPPSETRADRQELTILYLGRLVDFKGPDLTLRAFSRARERGLRARLIIAGEGALRASCEELRDELNLAHCVDIVGAVTASEGERLRREADIFTAHNQTGPHSRQEEAFGVAFVEAMGAGLPVVSGRSGSIPEIVRDRVDGLLFAPGDIEAHADALLSLERETGQRISMGRSAWERARKHFSLEKERHELRGILGLKRDPGGPDTGS
jgi:colanic acid/amylovoran biosynthesis glycosyltransferase